jgi:membrane fusion protein (multidrug efflux system)
MKTNKIIILGVFVLFLSACAKKEDLAAKKEELKEKKVELQKMESSIKELEKEISVLDPEFGKKNRKATLITTTSVENKNFEHFIEVSGAVKSRKNILISAENMGNIQSIPVKEGYEVSKGQLILSMDTELYQRTLEQLKTEYDLATTMFEKQSNLWDQNIGTEVQYLEAKNRKESLENQLANVRTQISKSQVRAPFAGTVEEVFVKIGEMAQPGSPLVRIVNHRDMYVKADLSETYIGNFEKGDAVIISFPSIDQTIESKISSVGQVIDEKNRTFSVEALLPQTKFTMKPNLIAVIKIRDFHQDNAVVIPSKLIQKDNLGDFVFHYAEKHSDEYVAKKVQIDRGTTYKNKTMVTNGLNGTESLIDEGFRDVAEGTKVKVVENVL